MVFGSWSPVILQNGSLDILRILYGYFKGVYRAVWSKNSISSMNFHVEVFNFRVVFRLGVLTSNAACQELNPNLTSIILLRVIYLSVRHILAHLA